MIQKLVDCLYSTTGKNVTLQEYGMKFFARVVQIQVDRTIQILVRTFHAKADEN